MADGFRQGNGAPSSMSAGVCSAAPAVGPEGQSIGVGVVFETLLFAELRLSHVTDPAVAPCNKAAESWWEGDSPSQN